MPARMINDDGYSVITLECLTKAIMNCTSHSGRIQCMSYEEAKQMAMHILNFFGYNDRIIDNILEQDDRDIFYLLEDEGILSTEREEITLHDGKEWRIHYWVLRRDKILEWMNKEAPEKEESVPEEFLIYEKLPDEYWSRV